MRMMVCVLLTLFSAVSFPQTAPEPVWIKHAEVYDNCITDFALVFAQTKEPARDIFSAAVSKCMKLRNRVALEIARDQVRPSTLEEARREVQIMDERLQNDVIRQIVELRNPQQVIDLRNLKKQ